MLLHLMIGQAVFILLFLRGDKSHIEREKHLWSTDALTNPGYQVFLTHFMNFPPST